MPSRIRWLDATGYGTVPDCSAPLRSQVPFGLAPEGSRDLTDLSLAGEGVALPSRMRCLHGHPPTPQRVSPLQGVTTEEVGQAGGHPTGVHILEPVVRLWDRQLLGVRDPLQDQ